MVVAEKLVYKNINRNMLKIAMKLILYLNKLNKKIYIFFILRYKEVSMLCNSRIKTQI